MSSRSFEARSIASQLILLFTLAAAVLLCTGLGVLYWIVVEHAFEEDNEVLADKVFAIRADLGRLSGPQLIDQELNLFRGGDRSAYWVRVLDPTNHPMTQTPGMDELLPAHLFPPKPVDPVSIPRPIDHRTDGKLFALLTTVAQIGGQPHTIQIAQDRSTDQDFSRSFRALLVAVLVCGIGASAVIARLFTQKSLRPIVELTQSFERIGPKRLDERVPPAGWPRELQPLAVAYDAMLDRLEESFTRLSQFSADLAHELRTPIANLRGESEVALTRMRTAEEYRDVIESNVAECERLSGIIDNLLFLARAEAADGPIPRVRFDGRAAIEKLVGYYETVTEERQITISCSGRGEIYADQLLFGRAVSNLVDNAVRYTADGGTIEIGLASDPRQTRVTVRDTGSGIAPEHLPRVFDRFYRAEPSRTSYGTGLGLALVRSIMDLHGGRAEVESEVGRGTALTLSFPHNGAAAQAA
jgi:two-component system heavy metal sensor histidine kinase CusS